MAPTVQSARRLHVDPKAPGLGFEEHALHAVAPELHLGMVCMIFDIYMYIE